MPGSVPWKARLWTVSTVPGRAPSMEVQVDRCHGGLPVMGVNDVERQTWDYGRPPAPPPPRSGQRSGCRYRATRPRPGRHTDCRRVRRDAARRPPADRAWPRCREARRRTAEQVGEFVHCFGVGQGTEHRRIARDHGDRFRRRLPLVPVAERRLHRRDRRSSPAGKFPTRRRARGSKVRRPGDRSSAA